jgi:tRNA 2-selenouridine synthase
MLHDQPLPFKAVLIDGYTGTGKTELLQHLAALGCQTLDLEALANHRGSLFGGHPDGQPSQKNFETQIAVALTNFDRAKPLLLEAESSKIGDLAIPPSLWQIMGQAQKVVVDAPAVKRAEYLTRRYADVFANGEKAAQIIASMKQLHGAEQIAAWIDLLNNGKLQQLAQELITRHYDPRYARHQQRNTQNALKTLTLADLRPADFAKAAAHIHAIL